MTNAVQEYVAGCVKSMLGINGLVAFCNEGITLTRGTLRGFSWLIEWMDCCSFLFL